jgi:membrane peptidoglycan carboxypeptidase
MSSPAPRRGRNVNAFQALALLGAFVLVASLGGVLSAGLAMPFVASAGGVANSSTQFFDQLPGELARNTLSQQSRIFAADGSLLATFYWENRIVVPLDQIAKPIQQAVIATEDKRFYEHGGIDPQGLVRAAVKNATTTDVQGGSTLTQQYVKNVLIEAASAAGDVAGVQAARETSLIRKLREAKLAITLEKTMTKNDILAGYLNIAPFGASVYGVEAASLHYFGKSAKDVTYVEAALLAGITQSPSKWDPILHPEAAVQRRDVVLGVMRDQGVITPAQYADDIKITIKDMLANASKDTLGCKAAGDSGFFCDYVTKVIRNDPAFGKTGVNLLYRGGLDIYTTLDPHLQTLAVTEVRNAVPDLDPSGLAAALVSVEPGTGKILAMAQNRTFDPAPTPPVGSTAVNYNTDKAYGGSKGFSPGSAFKPFVLTDWLEQGHSLSEVVDATEKTRKMSSFQAKCKGKLTGKDWRPGNVDGAGTGLMTVLKATANSVNTAFVDIGNQLDLCDIRDVAQSLGFHRADGAPTDVVPAMILGSNEVAPLTMAAADATFAANGTFCSPIAITKVVKDGKELPIPDAGCHQVLEQRITSAVEFAMSKVLSEGTAKKSALAGGRVAAGKTGTSQNNVALWFTGFTPQLATAVVVTKPEGGMPLQHVTINGKFQNFWYGADIAAPTWKRYMDQALAGQPNVPFPAPGNNELYGQQVSVPDVTGQSIDSAKAQLTTAGFRVTVSATGAFSPTASTGTVAGTTPASGTSTAKGGIVTIIPSNGPDPSLPGQQPGNPGNPPGNPNPGPGKP